MVPPFEAPLRRILALVLLAGSTLLFTDPPRSECQQSAAAKEPGGSEQGRVERGKYLVEGVAMCSMCHTPHSSNGDLERSRWLDGGALWLQPPRPDSNWPLRAPRLAGNPPGTDAEMTTLLTTGIWRDGGRLRAPMPQFRMTPEDAESVVAYLRSLKSVPGD